MKKRLKIALCMGIFFVMLLPAFMAIAQNATESYIENDVSMLANKRLPDLIVNDIYWYPSQPVAGQSVTIYVQLKNQGQKDIKNTLFYNHLHIDGVLSLSKSYTDLAAGSSVTFSKTTTFTAGSHSLKGTADVYDSVDEKYETNNVRTETINVASLPDVAASDIYTDPELPIGTMGAWIIYKATTSSTPFTATIYVDLYIDGVKVKTESIAGSEQSQTFYFFHYVILAGGDHELKMIVDSTNALVESSETNNQRIETITWQVGPCDLIISDIWTDPVYPLMDRPVTIYYTVKNVGIGPAIPSTPDGTFGTGLWIDGILVAGFNTGTLYPGESATGSFQTTLGIGLHTLYANCNFGRYSQVPGDDRDNNPREEIERWYEYTSYDSDSDGLCNGVEYGLGTDPYGCDRWAVIVIGGWGFVPRHPNWIQWAFVNDASHIYMALTGAGYTRDHIYIISMWDLDLDHDGDADVYANADPTYENAYNAIYSSSGWLRTHADADDKVFIYMTDHGRDPDGHFLLNGWDSENPVFISDEEMGTWVDAVTCYRLIFVLDSCFSGQFQDDLNDPHDNERIILTATNPYLEGYAINPDVSYPTGDEWSVYTMYFVSYLPSYSIELAHYYAYYDVRDWAIENEVTFQQPQGSDSDPGVYWYL